MDTAERVSAAFENIQFPTVDWHHAKEGQQ